MDKFYWEPTRDDLLEILQQMYKVRRRRSVDANLVSLSNILQLSQARDFAVGLAVPRAFTLHFCCCWYPRHSSVLRLSIIRTMPVFTPQHRRSKWQAALPPPPSTFLLPDITMLPFKT